MRGESFLYHAAVTALIRSHLEKRAAADASGEVLSPRASSRSSSSSPRLAHPSKSLACWWISVKTVERHPNNLEKLGMRDRVELTRYAIRRGPFEP
jgi:hypothetical protein